MRPPGLTAFTRHFLLWLRFNRSINSDHTRKTLFNNHSLWPLHRTCSLSMLGGTHGIHIYFQNSEGQMTLWTQPLCWVKYPHLTSYPYRRSLDFQTLGKMHLAKENGARHMAPPSCAAKVNSSRDAWNWLRYGQIKTERFMRSVYFFLSPPGIYLASLAFPRSAP